MKDFITIVIQVVVGALIVADVMDFQAYGWYMIGVGVFGIVLLAVVGAIARSKET